MKIFLGIGLGPIQTGIFLSGAERNFDKLVVAEVDDKLVDSVRNSGGKITINIACADRVIQRTIGKIEIYNPANFADLRKLVYYAGEAEEICTALPSVGFFDKVAVWLRDGFANGEANKRRFIYTAENHNHAAEILREKIALELPDTHYLNTVIGKMSCVVFEEECKRRSLSLLADGAGRGHLVEEFNKILISNCPNIEERKVENLIVKQNLLPFEEAKLYGHNAVHFLLGMYAKKAGLIYMHQLATHPDLIEIARKAFIDESGYALLKKWKDERDFFDEHSFREYAEDLLRRMLNPFLMDPVARVCRDLERKLSWEDRVIGTIRLCHSQGIKCVEFAKIACMASEELFQTDDKCEIRKRLSLLWGNAVNTDEVREILDLITGSKK